MVRFENISKRFKDRTLYGNLDFHVRKGEKAALTGPSGSGKTTVLNMIMGLDKPDSGTIYVGGEILSRSTVRTIRKQIGWLPQGNSFFGSVKVIDAVRKPFTFAENRESAPDDRIIEEMFELFNLEKSVMNELYTNISGGEKQRVGLIITLLLGRPLLLLDEPTSALDAATKTAAIEAMITGPGLTIITSTHDEALLSKCDKLIRIADAGN